MPRRTILLVEDDVMVGDAIKSSLERKYHVLMAMNCSEAAGMSDNSFDLAVVDFSLPDGDGTDLIKTLRKKMPALPAIIITAFGAEDVAVKAIKAGVTDYIKKPLSLALLNKRISELLGEEDIKEDEKITTVENREDFLMDSVAAYINERCMKELTLEEIADRVHMNKSKFCRAFKKRFGQTFIAYLNSVRAKKAAAILKSPDLNVTEIAYFVGCENVVHLERIFKAEYGISPREYRKKLRGN